MIIQNKQTIDALWELKNRLAFLYQFSDHQENSWNPYVPQIVLWEISTSSLMISRKCENPPSCHGKCGKRAAAYRAIYCCIGYQELPLQSQREHPLAISDPSQMPSRSEHLGEHLCRTEKKHPGVQRAKILELVGPALNSCSITPQSWDLEQFIQALWVFLTITLK